MRKNTPQKGNWIHYEHSEISHRFMDRVVKQSIHQFHKKFCYISKCLACNAEKNIRVEDNNNKKKRMSIASYINIYTCVICDGNDSNKNDSINLNSAVWSFC